MAFSVFADIVNSKIRQQGADLRFPVSKNAGTATPDRQQTPVVQASRQPSSGASTPAPSPAAMTAADAPAAAPATKLSGRFTTAELEAMADGPRADAKPTSHRHEQAAKDAIEYFYKARSRISRYLKRARTRYSQRQAFHLLRARPHIAAGAARVCVDAAGPEARWVKRIVLTQARYRSTNSRYNDKSVLPSPYPYCHRGDDV